MPQNQIFPMSVLIVLLLSTARSGIGSRNSIYGGKILNRHQGRGPSWSSSAIFPAAAAVTQSMSGYSMLFANGLHPTASYSKQDNEIHNNDNDSNSCSSTNNKDEESSSPSTCEAKNNTTDDEVAGRSHPDDDCLLLFHYKSTPSTQNEAKKIAEGLSTTSVTSPGTFCVTAASQTSGRGTSGRKWLGAPGNVFVTIGIPVDLWMTSMFRERKVPLTLLPLKIGELTASLVRSRLDGCGATDATVTVKWPNDVLVDGKKISGTLIEAANDWYLIGIGINVAHAPTVATTGTDYGRPSVSLRDYGCESEAAKKTRDETARDLGVELALAFHRWIYGEATLPPGSSSGAAESIIRGWKRFLDTDAEWTIRNDNEKGEKPRIVKILDVLPDGRIRVTNQGNGKEEILVSDYFV